jgi:hypothetical protein
MGDQGERDAEQGEDPRTDGARRTASVIVVHGWR